MYTCQEYKDSHLTFNIWDASQVNLHNDKWSKAQGCLKLNAVCEAIHFVFQMQCIRKQHPRHEINSRIVDKINIFYAPQVVEPTYYTF